MVEYDYEMEQELVAIDEVGNQMVNLILDLVYQMRSRLEFRKSMMETRMTYAIN